MMLRRRAIVKAKLPGQMFCSSGGRRPAGFMASRYRHHLHYHRYLAAYEAEVQGGGNIDRTDRFVNSALENQQRWMQSWRRQSVVLVVTCRGAAGPCGEMQFTLSRCIALETLKLAAWAVLQMHWSDLPTLATNQFITQFFVQ